MTIGLLGRKIGMTRIFSEVGGSIPITVIEITANRVTQIKTSENEGYEAIQLTGGSIKPNKVKKPLAGHFAKAKVEPGNMIKEFRISKDDSFEIGQEIRILDIFKEGQFVDVSGVSKGKGFAGTVKRYNFRTQDATHGNSRSHRVPGSIGQNQTPGRVFKGKKMAGHMGNERCTVQNLEVIKIEDQRNLLLVKGSIPGHIGTKIEIKPAVKKLRGKK